MNINTHNSFTHSRDAMRRIGSFLVSPERLSPTHNINNYWQNRRMALNFTLEPDGILITGDSNLSNRITARDRENLAKLPRFPGLPWVARIVGQWASWAAQRAERIVELSKIKRRVALASRLQDHLFESVSFRLPEEIEKTLKESPFVRIYSAWPARASLMLEALSIIHHYAYAPKPTNSSLWVLEVGSGPAILAGLMANCLGSKHVLIDLPEQIVVGFSMLAEFFPDKKAILPNEVGRLGTLPADHDIVFITPEQLSLLESHSFEVAVNMFSFGEMSAEAVQEYFLLIRRHLVPGGIFYCANRVSKMNPHDGTLSEFDSYPWLSADRFLFDRDMAHVFGGNSGQRECVIKMTRGV